MIFYYCIYAGSLQACRWLLSIVMRSRGLFIKFPAGCWYVLKCEIVSEEVLEIPPCDWGYEMNTKFLSFECLKTHQPSYFNFIGWYDEVQCFLRNATICIVVRNFKFVDLQNKLYICVTISNISEKLDRRDILLKIFGLCLWIVNIPQTIYRTKINSFPQI